MKPSAFLVFLVAASTVQGEILKVDIDGVINPITAQFITKAVNDAEDRQAEFLLIRLSTPGGLGISMDEIIQQILQSKVPVVCFVEPSGSHAASAGFFILLAADVAAMAPGTNTGAATPVAAVGEFDETMTRKITNNALASLRSIVERRERNYDLAEKAVTEAASYTATEALEGKLIDLIAKDQDELLEQLEGREVARFDGSKHTLKASGQTVVTFEPNIRDQVLEMVANPQVAAILGMIGLLGLYFEFNNPGSIVPGVIGAICLLLSLTGYAYLPINWIGVALILLALGLLVAEVKVQGFGVLGIGGATAMFFGLLLLIDSPFPDVRIGVELALGITIAFALVFAFLVRLAVKAFGSPVATGNEALIGVIATARSEVGVGGGKVFLQGEWWNAYSDRPIAVGSRVQVVSADNLRLKVAPVENPADQPPT